MARAAAPSPPAPVADVEDAHYPAEEAAEWAAAQVPLVQRIGERTCVLRAPGGRNVTAAVGELVFAKWTVVALLAAAAPRPGVVFMERRWQRWGMVVSTTVGGGTPWDHALRKPLGALEALRTARYDLTAGDADYFVKAARDPLDFLGQRIVNESEHGEASFLTAAKFLPPIRDFLVLGDVHAPVKAVLTMDGKIKRADGADDEPSFPRAAPPIACTSSAECTVPPRDRSYCFKGACVPGGGVVFDAVAYLGLPSNFSEMQAGVLGGHLRVASLGAFDAPSREGFEMMALGPLGFDNDTLLVAIRRHVAGAPPNASYTYLRASLDRRACRGVPAASPYCAHGACCVAEAAEFYQAVGEHAAEWRAAFRPGMRPTLPWAERRQLDMARGVIVASSTVWIGDRPNYGTGGDYWLSGPPVRDMMDTSATPDSLPLTSLALDTALLQWGLFDSALSKIGFYFDTFVYPNGTIDMGHWKDVWLDASTDVYNCTFPDGLPDMGRMLQLFAEAVYLSRNTSWMAAHLKPAADIGEYLLRARAEALAAFPANSTDARRGMIYGPAEHDTCSMGMGVCTAPSCANDPEPAALVGGQWMNWYFSSSMWSWRGMVELGNLLRAYPNAHPSADAKDARGLSQPELADLATRLLDEAARFKVDIDAALEAASVRDAASGRVAFVPAAVVPRGTKPPPYANMTMDRLASYSNFRYYSEMLSSGAMSDEMASGLMDFREGHGGCLSGMTRYTDHLDDMPAIGYALSALEGNRTRQFLLLLHGHTANYHGRGSFFTTEQQSLYQDASHASWRASLGELQADFCTPSQTLVASMTAMQLVHAERDAPTLWLARGAPRRWYAAAANASIAFGVQGAPSRYGTVGFEVGPFGAAAGGGTAATLTLDFGQPAGAKARPPPTLKLRVRDPRATSKIAGAAVSGGADCEVAGVEAEAELVVVRPTAAAAKAGAVRECALLVAFSAH